MRKQFFSVWMTNGGSTFLGRRYSYTYSGKGPNGEYKNLIGGKFVQSEVGKVIGTFEEKSENGSSSIVWNLERKDGTNIIVYERRREDGERFFREWIASNGVGFIGRDYEFEIEELRAIGIGFI